MDQQSYFRARERAERAAAKYASSPQVRRVHQELAQAYSEKLRGDGTETSAAKHIGGRATVWTVLGE